MEAWIAGVNIALATACHLLLPSRWAVVGMAGAYTLSYVAGLALTAHLLRRGLGTAATCALARLMKANDLRLLPGMH